MVDLSKNVILFEGDKFNIELREDGEICIYPYSNLSTQEIEYVLIHFVKENMALKERIKTYESEKNRYF